MEQNRQKQNQYNPITSNTPTAKNNLYIQTIDYRDNLKTKEELEKFRKNKPLWELIVI